MPEVKHLELPEESMLGMDEMMEFTQTMKDLIQTAQSGFEDDTGTPFCRHQQHLPPTNLYIPQGQRYRHVCPGCGNTVIIRTLPVSLSGFEKDIL